MLIRNGTILPLEEGEAAVRCDIRVVDGRIDVMEEGLTPLDGEDLLDAEGCWVLPGLISVGADLGNTLLPEVEEALAAVSSGMSCTAEMVRCALSREGLDTSVRAGALAMLKQGVTTVLDVSDEELSDVTFEAVSGVGLRFVGGRRLSDIGQPPERLLQDISAQIDRWHEAESGRIRCAVSLGLPMSCSDELLQSAAALAFENDLSLHCDLLMTSEEAESVHARADIHAVEFLMEMGCLGSQTMLAGCHQLQAAELNFLFGTGTHVVDVGLLADASQNSVSGRAALRDAGVNLALSSVLGTGQTMALAARAEAIGWTSRAMLQLCVEGGAAALSLDESVGYLQQGYAADLIVVEGSSDCDDPHSAVLEASAKHLVRDVLIDGIPRVREGRLLPVQSPESIATAVAQIVASLAV